MDNEFEIADYIRILKKYWVLAALIFIAVFSLAMLYTFVSPKIYEARSLVMVNSQDQTSYLLDATMARVDMETQRELIMSLAVLDPIYTEYGKDSFYLDVQPIKTSNVLEITVQSTTPEDAQEIANKIARSYQDYIRESRKSEAADTRDFITEQLDIIVQEIDGLNKELRGVAQGSEEYMALTRNIQAKQNIYEILLARREEVGIAAEERSGNVKIIELASFDDDPVKPNYALNIFLGLFISFIAAVGGVVGRVQLSGRFTTLREIEAVFGDKLIGTLSYVKQLANRKYMILAYGSNRLFTEEIRKIRIRLMLRQIKVLAVTSAREQEGKSTIAANLAKSVASGGRKVLLVDANLRAPVVDKAFGIKDKVFGISEYLKNPELMDKSVKVKATKDENLFVIPAGSMGKESIDMLTANAVKHLMARLEKSEFDTVIIDTGSLEYAETSLFASGNVVFVASDKLTKQEAVEAVDSVEKIGSIIGIVYRK